jgi:hypothetical protein
VETTFWRKSVSSSRSQGNLACRHLWRLNGVVIAEIELRQETQALSFPSRVGKEVTGDPYYKKINMRARAFSSARATAPPCWLVAPVPRTRKSETARL